MTAEAPKCPRCNSSDASPIDHPTCSWLCGRCDWAFAGGDIERLRMTPRREAYLMRPGTPTKPPPTTDASRHLEQRAASHSAGGET